MNEYETYDTTVVKDNSDFAPRLVKSSGPAVRTTQWKHMATPLGGGTNYFVACVAHLLAPFIKGDMTNGAFTNHVDRTKKARHLKDMAMTPRAMVRPDSSEASSAPRGPPAKGGGWIRRVAL